MDAADTYCYLRARRSLALAADPIRAAAANAAHADAVTTAEAALRKHRELNGDAHPRTIFAHYRYADSLIASGQRTAGMAHLTRALNNSEHVLGRDHRRTWELWIELARRLAEQGDTDRAEDIYRTAVGVLARLFGEHSV
jgi:hypothetical protein